MSHLGAAAGNISDAETWETAMNNSSAYVLAAGLAVLLTCGQAFAHRHSSNYDMSKSVSVKGTITQFAFMNPHPAIQLEAKDDEGNAEQWLIQQTEIRATCYFSALAAGFSGGYLINFPPSDS